jgi:hypothetical protein
LHNRRRGDRERREWFGRIELLRYGRRDHDVALCAFDLLELEGYDTRRTPLEERKGALAKLLGGAQDGIAFSEHYSGEGAIFYKHACALGCEGIVSKRLGSPYHAGRAGCWIKADIIATPSGMLNRRALGATDATAGAPPQFVAGGVSAPADHGNSAREGRMVLAPFAPHPYPGRRAL